MTNRIESAFTALRSSALSTPEVWRPIYRDGLREAFERSQLDDVAGLAIFAAVCLEAQGYYDDALAELDFALSRTTTSPDVTAKLLSVAAALRAIRGDPLAFDTIEAAVALKPDFDPDFDSAQTSLEVDVERALIECVFLHADSVDLARKVADRAQAEGAGGFARGLDIWAVPAMVAFGQRRRAVPWVNSLAAHAEAESSPYRMADAAALDFCLRSVEGFPVLDTAPLEQGRRNNMAAWRAQTSALRNAVLRQDTEHVATALDALNVLAARLNPGHADGLPALREAARLDADDVGEDLRPPAEVTLVNLPAALAGMEVVAARGLQEQAVAWARWAEERLPSHVRTSIEWPASRDRLHALLLVRVGDVRGGTALMERGLRWAKSAGYPMEAALCELQLSELWALRGSVPERRWSQLQRTSRAALREHGVDYRPYALTATGALAWGRAAKAEPKLSPREVEVLGLLAEGLSYKDAALRLGIGWRTVQVHATHVYEKLGVSGKVMAARRAAELGIIGPP